MRGSAPNWRIASLQNGSRRQMRGSLSTNRRLAPYSSSSSACARSRNSPAAGEESQSGLNRSQSSQEEPADCSSASLSAAIGVDSQ